MGVNIPVIERWVEALESGRYQQTTGTLHRLKDAPAEPHYYRAAKSAGMCCLGVLCDLAVQDRVIPPPVEIVDDLMAYAGRDDLLPLEVQRWAGLTSESPSLTYLALDDETEHGALAAELNDEMGFTFAQIAEAIRRTYLKADS